MDSQPAAARIPSLLISACGAWETATGRKLTDTAAVIDFLRALKSDEMLLQHIHTVTHNKPEMREAARQLHKTLVIVDFTDATPLADILFSLGVNAEIRNLIMATLNNTASREELIKTAFASKDPATVAWLLEQLADSDNLRSFPARLAAALRTDIGACLGTDTGKLTAAGLLLGLLLAAYYIGKPSPPDGSYESMDRPYAISATYKGVTPGRS